MKYFSHLLSFSFFIAIIMFAGCSKNSENTSQLSTSASTFITISVDGTTYTWDAAPDSLMGGLDTMNGVPPGVIGLATAPLTNPLGTTYYASVCFDVALPMNLPAAVSFRPVPLTISMNSQAPGSMFGSFFPITLTSPPVITEFGPIGQYLSANFAGTFKQVRGNFIDTVNVTCSFRVPRIK